MPPKAKMAASKPHPKRKGGGHTKHHKEKQFNAKGNKKTRSTGELAANNTKKDAKAKSKPLKDVKAAASKTNDKAEGKLKDIDSKPSMEKEPESEAVSAAAAPESEFGSEVEEEVEVEEEEEEEKGEEEEPNSSSPQGRRSPTLLEILEGPERDIARYEAMGGIAGALGRMQVIMDFQNGRYFPPGFFPPRN